jgi:hypothetical protein
MGQNKWAIAMEIANKIVKTNEIGDRDTIRKSNRFKYRICVSKL